MKPFVTAVVVAHDAPEYLSVTLDALHRQSVQPDQILQIDATSSLAQSLLAARAQMSAEAGWLWLLHDDSAPKHDALEELLKAVELSPAVALAGPKQLDWNNHKKILQQGLTLTPMGELFSLVSGELDQSQHDHVDDVLAVGTAGALIRVDLFDELNGLDGNAPPLAADIDFSIRARLAGHRVIVVPTAKVIHAGLSLAGKRERRWLGTTPKAALRRASIHLRLAYSPLWLALLFWLALPAIGLLRAIWRVAAKRPDKLWSEISSAIWGYFTLFARLGSRRRIAKTSKFKFKALSGLLATWPQVRTNQRARLEEEQTALALQAFERQDEDNQPTATGFVAAGGVWFMLILTALSIQFWPSNIAATGGGLLPLSDSWFELFARAGASYQPISLGFFAPSDPFIWVLTALGSLTFWAPSLSIALLLLAAKALAFLGAWRVASLFVSSALARTSAALIFALWPSFTLAQTEGRLPALITGIALPWLVLAVARAAKFGRNQLNAVAGQAWVWVAVSGLLLAVVGASSPSLIPILLVTLAAVILVRIKRFGYLIWVPLPLAAITAPSVLYYWLNLQPLAQLADPGLAQPTQQLPLWQTLLGGAGFDLDLPLLGSVSLWLAIPAVILAAIAPLSARAFSALGLWVFALVATVSGWFMASMNFPAVGVGSTASSLDYVNGASAPHQIFAALALACLVALTISQASKRKAAAWLAAGLVALTVVPAAAVAATTQTVIEYTDGRVVPSIVGAEASLGSQLKMLVVNPAATADGKTQLSAEIVSGDGIQLEDVSLSYRFALRQLQVASGTTEHELRAQRYFDTARLVADLASANGTDLTKPLQQAGIGYVLMPPNSSTLANDLAISLDAVRELEPVGKTDAGLLWRVREPDAKLLQPATDQPSVWSITKVVQLSILLGFVLLAVPTSTGVRRKGADSTIFVEAGEE